jgi:hypothetical protein
MSCNNCAWCWSEDWRLDLFSIPPSPTFPSPRPLGLLGFLLFLDLKLNSPLELRPPGPNQAVYREDCTQCFDSIVSHSTFDGFPMLHYTYGASWNPRKLIFMARMIPPVWTFASFVSMVAARVIGNMAPSITLWEHTHSF